MPIFHLHYIAILELVLTKSLDIEEPFKKISHVADEPCHYWTLELITTILGKCPRKIPLTFCCTVIVL